MKIKLTFKSPDVLYYALKSMAEEDKEKAKEVANKYVKYGELITIELDSETAEAKVLEVRE